MRAEQIFASARAALAARAYPAEISYGVRISGYDGTAWRGRTYRAFERWPSGKVIARTISDEEKANPYKPKGTNVDIPFLTHIGGGPEPKSEKDILGLPQLAITYAFGLVPPPAKLAPSEAATPAPGEPRVIGSVSVAKRNYDVRYAGEETVGDRACYHLTLKPLGNPGTYRIRDLYVEETSNQIVRLRTDGNFTSKTTGSGLWTVDYAQIGDSWYLADEAFDGPVDTDAGHFDRLDVRFVDAASDLHENLDFGLSKFDEIPPLEEPPP